MTPGDTAFTNSLALLLINLSSINHLNCLMNPSESELEKASNSKSLPAGIFSSRVQSISGEAFTFIDFVKLTELQSVSVFVLRFKVIKIFSWFIKHMRSCKAS